MSGMSAQEEASERIKIRKRETLLNKIVSMLYQAAEKWVKEEFWKNTHDSGSKLNLPKLIEERLVKDNKMKDPDYFNHREGVVHSTSLSKCLRGVVHEMLGAKKDGELDARKLSIFKAGN